MVRPVTVSTVRTHRLDVSKNLNAGKEANLRATHERYQILVGFYQDVLLGHTGVFDLTQNARQNALEQLTTSTPARVVPPDLDVHHLFPGTPARFRGAAIHAALAAVEAYLARLEAYNEQQATGRKVPKRERLSKPQFPRVGQHPVMYQGMSSLDPTAFQAGRNGGGFVRLKLLDPTTNIWVRTNVPVNTRPGFHALLKTSAEEDERIQAERAAIKAEATAAGRVPLKSQRLALTPEEKNRVRRKEGAPEALSPSLVITKKGIRVCVPFKYRVQVTRAREGLAAGKHEKVVTVDLNERNVTMIAWSGTRVVKVLKHSYADLEMNRERRVETIYRKRRLSGPRVPKGERFCSADWDYVKNLGETLAHQLAARITKFALEHGCTIVVFEHLRNYRPRKGGPSSRARRANRRRSFWLRGRIQDFTGEKALLEGVLVVRRNPAFTSQCCPHCNALGERFSPSSSPANRSRYQCGQCGWEGDADVVAALNLHQKWKGTFKYPSLLERQEHRDAVERKSWERSQAAGTANTPGNPAVDGHVHDAALSGANTPSLTVGCV